jgi:hypothetical protein
MLTPPNPADLFSDEISKAAVAERFELFKSALKESARKTARGAFRPDNSPVAIPVGPSDDLGSAMDVLTKSLSAEQLSEVQATLDKVGVIQADLAKDWTETNPFPTGPVPFDLQAPAKMLIPVETPIYNSTPKSKGQGEAARYKRLLGVTGSGTGGVADMSPFMRSSTQSVAFGPTSYRRPNKINYAADEHVVPYTEWGVSDQVDWRVDFAARGFENVRTLSQTALMWSHLLLTEKAMLYGRGATANSYSGPVTPPGTPTLAASAASANQTGNSADIATLYVGVTAKGGYGETLPTAANTTALAAATGDVVTVTVPFAEGQTGYNVYVGTAANALYYSGSTGSNTYVINFTGGGTGGVPDSGAQPPTTDTSSDPNGFDGLIPVLTGPNSGYVKNLDANFGTSNPGSEFQTLFGALWENVRANPDDIWLSGNGRVALNSLLQNSSGNSYRINITNNDGGTNASIGQMVTGIQNGITGKMLNLNAHPFMPAGIALVVSRSIPTPDSNISNAYEMRMVQDLMSIEWPVVQFTYDASTYVNGTMIHYAPAWSGALTGIANG